MKREFGAQRCCPHHTGVLWLPAAGPGGLWGVCSIHWAWRPTGGQPPSTWPQPFISRGAGSELMPWECLWVPSTCSGTLPLVLHLVCELNAGCHALHGKTCLLGKWHRWEAAKQPMLHSYVWFCGVSETPLSLCMLWISKCLPQHLNAEGRPRHHGSQTQPLGG